MTIPPPLSEPRIPQRRRGGIGVKTLWKPELRDRGDILPVRIEARDLMGQSGVQPIGSGRCLQQQTISLQSLQCPRHDLLMPPELSFQALKGHFTVRPLAKDRKDVKVPIGESFQSLFRGCLIQPDGFSDRLFRILGCAAADLIDQEVAMTGFKDRNKPLDAASTVNG